MKRVMQNGKVVTSLDELVDGFYVEVQDVYTADDLPLKVDLATGVRVDRDAFCAMVRVFTQSNKISAVKWVRTVMKWGLKEAKFFVDGLLQEVGDELPCITRDDVKNLVGPVIYDRAVVYHVDNRVYNIERDGMVITARSDGSLSYDVKVVLGESGIVSNECSCQYPYPCKHVGALLLDWIENPI